MLDILTDYPVSVDDAMYISMNKIRMLPGNGIEPLNSDYWITQYPQTSSVIILLLVTNLWGYVASLISLCSGYNLSHQASTYIWG